MQSTPRTLTSEERRLVLAISRVAWRTLNRWERGLSVKSASDARIAEAVTRVRAGAEIVLRAA
jgi:hypothetical protein